MEQRKQLATQAFLECLDSSPLFAKALTL